MDIGIFMLMIVKTLNAKHEVVKILHKVHSFSSIKEEKTSGRRLN